MNSSDWNSMQGFQEKGLEASLAGLALSQNALFIGGDGDKRMIGANNRNQESITAYNNTIFPPQGGIALVPRHPNTLHQGPAGGSNGNIGGNGGSRDNFYWNMEHRDLNVGRENTAGNMTANSIMDSTVNTKESAYNTTVGSNHWQQETVESMQLELQLKETQIESLETEIQSLKRIFNQGLSARQEQDSRVSSASQKGRTVEMPVSLESIFHKMSSVIAAKDKELEETSRRLESIVTAIALNPSNSVTKLGRYDEEALAHKMVVRLETLTKENQDMAKMLGYGRSKEQHIELELIKRENQELKRKLSQVERKALKD
ncbi:Mum2p [Lachancea thermotolerans CBS 6340]|uniref:KLTH0C07348p n=1 Tax=Lachancea thermotolerans (strain ATCC 56472 / CBS 6340 / NRRL Y-8284) TaxID=559295 RepID=C5DE96_LACTC|nr:KLTH0C07348p [Lachancea thermotolerans CBS 6340]CAR22107.1 KLTH0C07348p [Lachancea thermotolerans CBS 6340]